MTDISYNLINPIEVSTIEVTGIFNHLALLVVIITWYIIIQDANIKTVISIQ